jgi:hypothetical protein
VIIKTRDSKKADFAELNFLAKRLDLNAQQLAGIQQVIHNLTEGDEGEKDSAYQIDLHLKDSKDWAVIHDLRIEHNGFVAQIDHVLISRWLEIYVVETKHYNATSLEFNEMGECTATYPQKGKIGIDNPLKQNNNHIFLFKSLCKTLPLPKYLGISFNPYFESIVLVSNSNRIFRPKGFDTNNVIKTEQIIEYLGARSMIKQSFGAKLRKFYRKIDEPTLKAVAELLIGQHRPMKTNYKEKFKINDLSPSVKPPHKTLQSQEGAVSNDKPIIKKINSTDLATKLGMTIPELFDKRRICRTREW